MLKDKIIDLMREWYDTHDENSNEIMEPYHYNSKITIICGGAGSGKTIKAVNMSNLLIVGDSDLSPEYFILEFKNGTFKESDFIIAMKVGKTVCIDDFTLLPDSSFHFIEDISINDDFIASYYVGLDEYEIENFKINPNFKMILVVTPNKHFL